MNSSEARKRFTEWMNDPAAADAITKEGSIDASWIGFWEGWKAALSAAPTPPAQEEPVAWPPECEELCQAAEGMQRAINELWKAEYPEELDEDQKHMGIDEARELHTEAWNALSEAIHYMRKRMNTPLYTAPN